MTIPVIPIINNYIITIVFFSINSENGAKYLKLLHFTKAKLRVNVSRCILSTSEPTINGRGISIQDKSDLSFK